MKGSTNFLIYLFSFIFFSNTALSVDTLGATQSLGIDQTLVSPKEVFEFGFFNPNSSSWYLGIWYKDTPDKTVVWVANRDTPLENSNGTLKIGGKGNLVLLDQTGNSIWSAPNQTIGMNPILELLDSGNLVLIEANEKNTSNYLWQSFDYPTDTLLPGMKLGWNLDTGIEYHLTSWKSQNDPSSGDFSFRMEYRGLPELFLWNKQNKEYRSGAWNGIVFTSLPILTPKYLLEDTMSVDAHKVYFTISEVNQSKYTRVVMNWTGEIQRLIWVESSQSWNKLWYGPKDECDQYHRCGPYAICNSNAFPVCSCIQGFSIRNQEEWNLRNFSSGCVRNTRLDCGKDKFQPLQHVQPPETTTVFVNRSMTLVECEDMCTKTCSCTAYANVEITNGGTGCVMWNAELSDTRQFSDGGQDLYVRLAASDVGNNQLINVHQGHSNRQAKISSSSSFLPSSDDGDSGSSGTFERNQHPEVTLLTSRDSSSQKSMDDLELPLFDFNTITAATNNFSEENKLGQGGFGNVYLVNFSNHFF
ncbi:hypothetical protein VNO77_22101 [Canavalia gladiata]|uniref:Uncharacterized protein n=1 Tax=Canavalia gladiata TaxID=3824 RepID=A0AAN9QAH2_CANGL